MFKKLVPFPHNLKCFVRNTSINSVDTGEINHFKQFTQEWWDEMGYLRALHTMNKLRIPLIRDGLINAGIVPQHNINSPTPLKAISILDVGCGGGILTEPLARIGGDITGLDPNCDIIEMAKCHAKSENLENIHYVCSSIENHSDTNIDKYDAIVVSEVVEHITQKEEFLKTCLKCLKPGGSIFLTTINKTCIANLAGILLAENVFKILPKGTHEFDKFIEPHKLQRILEDQNCKTVLVHGMFYNFITNEWFWSFEKSINYALHAIKLKKS